jgi:hypothetical protein
MYELDEETQELKLAEEMPPMGSEELKSLENWAHFPPLILKSGRCEHFIPKDLPEEEAEELKNKLAEEEPPVERFRAIQEDAPVKSLGAAWVSKMCGDSQQYS